MLGPNFGHFGPFWAILGMFKILDFFEIFIGFRVQSVLSRDVQRGEHPPQLWGGPGPGGGPGLGLIKGKNKGKKRKKEKKEEKKKKKEKRK